MSFNSYCADIANNTHLYRPSGTWNVFDEHYSSRSMNQRFVSPTTSASVREATLRFNIVLKLLSVRHSGMEKISRNSNKILQDSLEQINHVAHTGWFTVQVDIQVDSIHLYAAHSKSFTFGWNNHEKWNIKGYGINIMQITKRLPLCIFHRLISYC